MLTYLPQNFQFLRNIVILWLQYKSYFLTFSLLLVLKKYQYIEGGVLFLCMFLLYLLCICFHKQLFLTIKNCKLCQILLIVSCNLLFKFCDFLNSSIHTYIYIFIDFNNLLISTANQYDIKSLNYSSSILQLKYSQFLSYFSISISNT